MAVETLRGCTMCVGLQMSEGRRTQVTLLDDRRVELVVQPKLISGDLLDLVISYFSLKEKEFFGLAFVDQTGHYNWLQLDRKVLDHEFPRKTGTLSLYFRVQFFIESISHLRDSITIELFYLQAKAALFKGDIEVDSETAFELAAYVLQATDGDHTSDSKARNELKKLPVLPQSTLKEHPSLPYCEERVLFYYKRLGGLSRGQCIVCYMQLIESLATYGVHYYEIKDKSGLPWWLGLSFKGIGQYDLADRITPRKVFHWRQLQNIYYRDRKFSIEVIDPRRVTHRLSSINLYQEAREEADENFDELCDAISDPTTQVSVSKRTFGASNATVHAWYGQPVLIRSMWAMAVSQHQFYLDKKHSKERYPSQRSFSQIATDLTVSTGSLTTSSQASQASDYSSGISADTGTGTGDSTSNLTVLRDAKEQHKDKLCSSRELLALEGEAARKEMIMALKARKDALEERLKERLEELKKVCVREAELTGEFPLDYPRKSGEALPHIKRRVTTAFTLSKKTVNADNDSAENRQLVQLETEQEIQSKITTAARKLADDPTISKKVRKTRRESYKKSAHKLASIEHDLKELKIRLGLELPDKMAPKAEEEDMEGFEGTYRKIHAPKTPPPVRSLFSRERGRSKHKDKDDKRIRSKSVPRQLLNGGWRSPPATRKNKINDDREAINPVDIYSDIPHQNSTSSLPRKIKDGLRSRSKSHANYASLQIGPGKERTLKRARSEYRLHLKSARSEEFLSSNRDTGSADVVFTIGPDAGYEEERSSSDNVYHVNAEPVYNVNSRNEPDCNGNGDHEPRYQHVNSSHEPSYNTSSGPEPSYNTNSGHEPSYNTNPGHEQVYNNTSNEPSYNGSSSRHEQRYRENHRQTQHENTYETLDRIPTAYPGTPDRIPTGYQESPRYQRISVEYGDSPPIPLPSSRTRSKTPVSYNDSISRPSSGRGPPTYNGGSPRRYKIVNHNADRPPPPSYNNASNRTLPKQLGRYYESPELVSQRDHNYDPPPMRYHAASLHDLQHATRMLNFSHTDDYDIEYHHQPTSMSQPPSPKKHGSMGNLLNIKATSLPNQQQTEEEEQSFNNYAPYRGRGYYRSQQYQNYTSRCMKVFRVQQNDEFEDVNSFINQPYNHRGNDTDQGSSSSTHSSITSERDLMPPPPPVDHHRRRHNSFSSNQSTSSHSSHSSLTGPSQVNSAPFHVQQNPAFNRLTEYSNYASMQHTASYSSISSQNSSTSSASMYPEPQPAAVYRTTSSMVLRPQPAIGSGIAVSKVHYQPVTPMTCEPVSRSKKLAHGSVSSLHSYTASIEGSVLIQASSRQHQEIRTAAVQPRPDSYATPSEEGSYQGDAGESLADAFSEEMLTWFDEQEGVVKTGTLV
ncbi:LOW QUALITY PROTEIN: uncharacterized protein [Amphiura filiformis]|uniref:LOW QUALITY PROTEIN: uncharacterized protein n=1 Tax=Amphiura filiformis TaxID=82378 RepID=UPI003B20F010